ncbi:MAG: 4-hydroxybutyrate CoA-transferase [Chitinophagales bacterium]|nr:4-hydroxybutyrate CoA-transferase [Chitinophagales bacterium]
MNSKYCSNAEEAVQIIKSGHRVFVHTAAATPVRLLEAMTARHNELRDVEIVSAHTEGPAPYAADEYAKSFKISAFFVGHNIRKAVQRGRAHYVPIFLSEIPALFRSGEMPLDVAMVTVSKPNAKGFCSLGCSVDISNAAIDNAKYVIAQVNPNMPFVHGNGILHMDKITHYIEVDEPLFELPINEPSAIERKIGENVAELIDDGATLQMGIGGIPNAVLHSLSGHRGLGIHSEMISDGIIPLYERGVITGMNKKTDLGKIVAGFAFGSRKLYDFINENPIVNMMDVSYVNDTRTIRMNPNFIAINSAIEIDVLGQVCADSIGTKHYSGVGGQMDFIRGAALSEGGKAVLALPSRTKKGIPRIVSTLNNGASVVTTRAHVQYVATEYGVAYLYAQNLKERVKRMINIAHPEDRENLAKMAYDAYKILI